MDIFVMRHGEAEVMAKSDRERHLNRRGIQQAISQGEWLKSTMTVDKVLEFLCTRSTNIRTD